MKAQKEANDILMRAVTAMGAVTIDTIKRADDEYVNGYVATLREHFERFVPDIDGWIDDYQERKREEED